jgi:hypothetical protein
MGEPPREPRAGDDSRDDENRRGHDGFGLLEGRPSWTSASQGSGSVTSAVG